MANASTRSHNLDKKIKNATHRLNMWKEFFTALSGLTFAIAKSIVPVATPIVAVLVRQELIMNVVSATWDWFVHLT